MRVFKLLSFDSQDKVQQDRPFVGRQVEMQQFSAALNACAETGSGQAVYLRGEAGIGKTRLTEEFQRKASEAAEQRALVQWCRLSLADNVLWHSIPNEGARGRNQTAKLKAMGLLPGAPDLVFFWPGHKAALELKAPGGVLQQSQRDYGEAMARAGGLWAVAYSFPEAAHIIREVWKIPHRPGVPVPPQ